MYEILNKIYKFLANRELKTGNYIAIYENEELVSIFKRKEVM